MNSKEKFLKKVTVLIDTREQQNLHIVNYLNSHSIRHESRKLDFGDYSFIADGRDFSSSCIVERKGSIDEIFGNITKDRERFKKELSGARLNAGGLWLLLEGVTNEAELYDYEVPEPLMFYQGRKIKEIGRAVYSSLCAFSALNRYNIHVKYSKKEHSADKLLEIFYYHYHNYAAQAAPRKERNENSVK